MGARARAMTSASTRTGSPSVATRPAPTWPPSSVTSAPAPLVYQLLVYPVADARMETASYDGERRGVVPHGDVDAMVRRPLPVRRRGFSDRPSGVTAARRRRGARGRPTDTGDHGRLRPAPRRGHRLRRTSRRARRGHEPRPLPRPDPRLLLDGRTSSAMPDPPSPSPPTPCPTPSRRPRTRKPPETCHLAAAPLHLFAELWRILPLHVTIRHDSETGNAGEADGAGEDVVEHRFGETTGERVLLAHVIAAEKHRPVGQLRLRHRGRTSASGGRRSGAAPHRNRTCRGTRSPGPHRAPPTRAGGIRHTHPARRESACCRAVHTSPPRSPTHRGVPARRRPIRTRPGWRGPLDASPGTASRRCGHR